MTDKHEQFKVAERQLDIESLVGMTRTAQRVGYTHRDNFPKTPKGNERFLRSLRGIAREYLPATVDGHKDYCKSFLNTCGTLFNGMASVSSTRTLRDVLGDDALDSYAKQAGGEGLFSTLCTSMLIDAICTNKGYERKRAIDALFAASGFDSETFCSHSVNGVKYPITILATWAYMNRSITNVDPSTSMLLHETDSKVSVTVEQIARKWPVTCIHDGHLGTTYVLIARCDKNMEMDILKAASMSEVEFSSIDVLIFHDSKNSIKHDLHIMSLLAGETAEEFHNKNASANNGHHPESVKFLDECRSFILNAFTMAMSYPTYIESREAKTYHKKSRKSPIAPSVLASKFSRKSLTQIVAEQRAASGLPGNGPSVRPHIREGHWRRQFHGVRFEIANPDITVYEDAEGRRFHMKRIDAVFVNQAAFLNEKDGD
tara:strand:+ start:242 stop:1531 length:1290 start_codon:yes stop_codon:yes gene_type:complete